MGGAALQRTVVGRWYRQPSMTVAEVVTGNGRLRYVVVDNHGELVEPIARYLKYLDLCGKARNTLRTYAGSLARSEEHTSELQSQSNLVCRLLLEKKKTYY